MGDVQAGMKAWGELAHMAYARYPTAAFHLIDGDLVNRGSERDDHLGVIGADRAILQVWQGALAAVAR